MSGALIPRQFDEKTLKAFARVLKVFPEEGLVVGPQGKPIGCPDIHGHIIITVYLDKPIKVRRAHLIWWAKTGTWPTNVIDHDDRVRTNDKIDNLKMRGQRWNMTNKLRPDGNLVGAITNPDGGFNSFVQSLWVNLSLGIYPTQEEANAKYSEFGEQVTEYAKNLAEQFRNKNVQDT